MDQILLEKLKGSETSLKGSLVLLKKSLLLGNHTEETRIERDTSTPMFIAALLPRCPLADEWIINGGTYT